MSTLVLFQNFQVGFDKAKPQKMTMQKPGVYFLVLSNCGNFDQAVISGMSDGDGEKVGLVGKSLIIFWNILLMILMRIVTCRNLGQAPLGVWNGQLPLELLLAPFPLFCFA